MSRNRGLLLAGMFGILAMLVLSFMLILISVVGTQSTAMVRATPTPAPPTATPTPPPLAITAQQGWLTASTHLAFTQDIQFASSNPYVGYACGVAENIGQATPLQLSITNDGGRSWIAQKPTMLNYTGCGLQINPIHDNWLLLTAATCNIGCDGAYPDFYVSHDFGKTWSQLKVPTGENTTVVISGAVWAGTDLLLNVLHHVQYIDNIVPTHLLAASINGGPLQWVDSALFYSQMGMHPLRLNILGLGATWIAALDDRKIACTLPFGCLLMMQSTDHGATWQRVISTISISSGSVQTSADGKELFGYQSVTTTVSNLVVSHDAGQTWQALPADPTVAGENRSYDTIFAAPDGALFITFSVYSPQSSNQILIYTLAPNGTTWQAINTGTSGNALKIRSLVAVSIGPGGHAVALWAILQTFGNTSPLPSGITATYHAPTGG